MTEQNETQESKRWRKEKAEKNEAKPKKKRKILPTILLISLVLNLLLGAVLNYKWNDDAEYKQMFRTEISYAIQRFEEVDASYDQGNYMVGVAHLYTACLMTESMQEDNLYYQNSGDFYDLWNLAAAYPDEFRGYLNQLVPILKDMKKDRNFDDSDAIIALQELNSLVRVVAADE